MTYRQRVRDKPKGALLAREAHPAMAGKAVRAALGGITVHCTNSMNE